MRSSEGGGREPRRRFYGWILIPVVLVCYGFGISPAYYSWGFFGPELRLDLGLTAEQTGSIFGVFQFMFSAVGPLVGMAIARFGSRATITAGSLLCAVGFFMVSRADSAADCYLGYALIGGVGIGFSTILPAQALVSYWFERYRARAMAIVFTGGALVGMAINPFNAAVLENAEWRDAWVIIGGSSLLVALVSLALVRNTPASLGFLPDGVEPRAVSPLDLRIATVPARGTSHAWPIGQALRTPQFIVLTLAGVAYSVPWGVVSAHGGLHLRDELGVTAATAALIVGTVRVGASAVGRLSGALGDFVAPPRLLAASLLIEGLGVVLIAAARSQTLLFAGFALLGLGFGAAYVTLPVVFADFFGRAAFAATTGTRIMINGVFGYLAPRFAGRMADVTGSYGTVFWIMAAITLAGAAAAWLCRQPEPQAASSPAIGP